MTTTPPRDRKRKANPMPASEAAKLGRAASTWNRGPNCPTGRAKAAHIAYRREGARRRSEGDA